MTSTIFEWCQGDHDVYVRIKRQITIGSVLAQTHQERHQTNVAIHR